MRRAECQRKACRECRAELEGLKARFESERKRLVARIQKLNLRCQRAEVGHKRMMLELKDRSYTAGSGESES